MQMLFSIIYIKKWNSCLFGDHLKRYIYERAGLEEPYNEVYTGYFTRDICDRIIS